MFRSDNFYINVYHRHRASAAAGGEDYSVIHELTALLEQPYAEQSAEMEEKWYKKTPDWAQNMPGVSFMS